MEGQAAFDFDVDPVPDAPASAEPSDRNHQVLGPDLAQYARQLFEQLCRDHPTRVRPTLVWRTLRVSAGKAYLTKNTIGLSWVLLTTEERVRDTLIHEYAHLLAFDRHGPKAANHGEPWRAAMRELGAEPEVTHNYDGVIRNTRRQVAVYACKKCGQRFELARRLNRRRRYRHQSCGGDLKFVAVESRVAANDVKAAT